MLSQRLVQQSLRRLAGREQQHLSGALRFTAPGAIATGSVNKVQRRLAAAQTVDAKEAQDTILAQQRLNRPVSPHLSIYRSQITWTLSISHRITGGVLSGAFYVFGTAYLVAPLLGWHLESAVIASAFGAWPVALKVLTKTLVAFPFAFHSFNGIRHLVWDTASMITNQKVARTGWTVVGLSVVSALALALM